MELPSKNVAPGQTATAMVRTRAVDDSAEQSAQSSSGSAKTFKESIVAAASKPNGTSAHVPSGVARDPGEGRQHPPAHSTVRSPLQAELHRVSESKEMTSVQPQQLHPATVTAAEQQSPAQTKAFPPDNLSKPGQPIGVPFGRISPSDKDTANNVYWPDDSAASRLQKRSFVPGWDSDANCNPDTSVQPNITEFSAKSRISLMSATSLNSDTTIDPAPPVPGVRGVGGRVGHSLHGESAARRQATMELLFFASVGDPERCRVICDTWAISVADRSCCDYDRRTPLHLAAAEGCYAVVQWLLYDADAKPNPIDRFGRTPLEDAVRGDHGEVVKLLVAAGAKVRSTSGALIELQTTQVTRYAGLMDNAYSNGADEHNWEIDPSTLEIGPKVGQGEFGSVHRARWLGSLVAVKILRQADESGLGDFRTELNVLQKVHHPHTVRFFGACTKRQPYMIVTEFLPGGSLADMFKRSNAHFPSMRRAVIMALDCAKGMTYLHTHNKQLIVHRDLKPANLMLGGIPHETGTRDMAAMEGVIKIADFGLSRSLAIMQHKHGIGDSMHGGKGSKHGDKAEERSGSSRDRSGSSRIIVAARNANKRYDMTGETGSYRYMAPEVFRHEPYNSKVDVYAFAMIAYELFEGRKPFGAIHPVEAARRACMDNIRPKWGTTNRFGKIVPSELKKLVSECWAPDFEGRPDFNQIYEILELQLKELPEVARAVTTSPESKPCCSLQ